MGGLNVPFIVWHSSAVRNGTNEEIVSLADVMPTVLEAAGAPVPDGIDGKSLVPFLTGESPEGPRDSLASAGIHSSRWSYSYEANGENNKQDAQKAPLYAWYLEGDELLMLVTEIKPGLYGQLSEGYPEQVLVFDIGEDRAQRENLVEEYGTELDAMQNALNGWLRDMEVPLTSQQDEYQRLIETTEGG
jgi:arylsulfatase A-like enzyme